MSSSRSQCHSASALSGSVSDSIIAGLPVFQRDSGLVAIAAIVGAAIRLSVDIEPLDDGPLERVAVVEGLDVDGESGDGSNDGGDGDETGISLKDGEAADD